jgi:hypothetical protein
MFHFSIISTIKQLANFSHRTVTEDYTAETIMPGSLCSTPEGILHFSHVEWDGAEMWVICYRPEVPEWNMSERAYMFHSTEVYHLNLEAVN